MYDLIVVGAGPAGSFLSYLMARDGYRVLLIDKEEFPREKVCGGGISNKTVELLDFDIDAAVERRIVGAYLTYRNKHTVVKDIEGRSGVTVTRAAFDSLLLDKAKERGAIVLTKCRFEQVDCDSGQVDVKTSRGQFRARYLVGADGVFSAVRNQVFGSGLVSYAPAVEALVRVPQDAIELFENRTLLDFAGMPRGYGWIFPKRDHLNVGVFSIFGARQIRQSLAAFMARYGCLQDPVSIEYRGSAIPTRSRLRRYERGRVALIGDAAGFAESFYGEGIYFALKSAALAHRGLRVALDDPGSSTYSELVRQEMLPDMNYSRLNALLFFPVQRFGFYRMVRNQHVNHYFAELIAGHVGYKECFYKTLLTLPYWLFSKSFPYVNKQF